MEAKGKPRIKKLQGSPITRLFLDFLDVFMATTDKVRGQMGDGVWKEVFDCLEKTDKRASKGEHDERL